MKSKLGGLTGILVSGAVIISQSGCGTMYKEDYGGAGLQTGARFAPDPITGLAMDIGGGLLSKVGDRKHDFAVAKEGRTVVKVGGDVKSESEEKYPTVQTYRLSESPKDRVINFSRNEKVGIKVYNLENKIGKKIDLFVYDSKNELAAKSDSKIIEGYVSFLQLKENLLPTGMYLIEVHIEDKLVDKTRFQIKNPSEIETPEEKAKKQERRRRLVFKHLGLKDPKK